MKKELLKEVKKLLESKELTREEVLLKLFTITLEELKEMGYELEEKK